MERIALFFRLKPGCNEEYKKRHNNLWPEVKDALDNAGIHNYSIWNYKDMLFAYYEVDDNRKALEILNGNMFYLKWRKYMEDIIQVDKETGEKEYKMKLMFFHN